jgi:hypothetical protein
VAAVRIVDIFELTVPLDGAVANAVVNFSSHTVSLVTLITDAVRAGRPVVGLAFNSIGRWAKWHFARADDPSRARRIRWSCPVGLCR